MNQERWHRLKDIVADALEEDSPVARTAFLSRECAEDISLLQEAESFLAHADTISAEGTDRLEECAEAATSALRRESVSLAGQRIGAYVIVRELGHGGMATVYLGARADGYFEKEVAIKILKSGSGRTGELLGRFRAEREVLASLDHPNIAALFDAGTTADGIPYFVMEYVSGVPITTYVFEHHLTIRERLLLFLKVCAAVEAAHRKRVVHRDLKRGNILVNAEGEPKLLDFGIAKLLEEHPHAITGTGQQRLTPISASPEQARGDEVTTASDIYALGVLLYELLTSRTPHSFTDRHPGLDEVVRVVCEEEPLRPSAAVPESEAQRALRGDLDAVVLRAMRKNPADRYASVSDFEKDIHHYLKGEPVDARPHTLSYRLQRFAGRHIPSPAFVLATAAALIIAGALAFFAIHRATQPAAENADDKVMADLPEKSIAVLPFDDFAAGDGSSYFADGVQDDILTDLAKAADLKVISRSGVAPYRHGVRDVRDIGQTLGVAYVLEGSVRKLDDRVRVNVQLIDTRTDVQVWGEQYERKIDDLFALQSDLSQAIVAQLKGKLSAREKAAIESRPTNDVQAYDLYLQAKASFVKYEYEKTVQELDAAIARDPQFALAYCLLTNAHLYIYRFGSDHSPERLEKARVAAETAMRLAPNLPEAHLAMAQYYYNGLRDYEKAQAELAASPPSPTGRAKFFDLMALTERRLGHWKEALANGEKAWQLDPHDPFIATEVIQSYISLRKYAEAEAMADRAIKNIASPAAPFWSLKAESMLARGDPKQAEAWLRQAPEESDQKHAGLARAAYYQHDFARALEEIELARQSPMMKDGASLDLLRGTIFRVQGKADEAWEAFEKARQKLEKWTETRPDDAMNFSNLSWAYAGLGRKEDALRASQRAVQLAPSWRDATEGPFFVAMQAQIRAWLGEKDAAIEQLSDVVHHAAGPSFGELKLDPGWDDLRGDARFEGLVAETVKPISLD